MVVARDKWTVMAETAILALRDVEAASIQTEGDEVREIHVLTSANRPAKQIVRDVQTLLLTRFDRAIDHRVVSVAFTRQESEVAARSVDGASAGSGRVRFVSANLYVSGSRVQAQVELKWNGIPRMGSASGWSTRETSYALVARATLGALQEYLDEDLALGLRSLERFRFGGREAVVVAVDLLAHRQCQSLVGCCTVSEDLPQAVALATLDALNRVVSELPGRNPGRRA